MESCPSDTEVENSLMVSSAKSAMCYIEPVTKSVIGYIQMPPETHETVTEMGSIDRPNDQLHSGSGFSILNRSTLRKLVGEKSLDHLAQFGGVEGIATCLKTNLQRGIRGDFEDISRRTKASGTNSYGQPPTKSSFSFVWEAFKDPTIVILLICSALSLGVGIKKHGPKEGWYDGGSIFVAVSLVISVSAISNLRQNRQFDKLSKVRSNIPVEVVRNGRRQKVSIFEIVVGDVVFLQIGDQVPADGLFIDGHSLRVYESSVTGESNHIEIDLQKNPFLFSGTKVADGFARMLVTSVGMNTSWGEMISTISCDSNEQTPLQARLNKLTSSLGMVGLAVAFLVLIVLLVRYFTRKTEDVNGKKELNGSKTKADNVIDSVEGIIAAVVAIIVVAIPQGLSSAVTLSLAYSMRRMMADCAMVRKLSACETMSSATTICTDKTGTLTLNQMKVTKFWQGIEFMEGMCYTSIANNVLELLHQGISLNTTGGVYKSGVSGTNLEFSGSPTEKAILSWAVLDLDMDMEAMKKGSVILHVEAFNSERKRSGIMMRKVEDNTCHVHWKGAAEMIVAMCSHYYDSEGNMKALEDQERMRIGQMIQGMAAGALRCIAFAHKQVSEGKNDSDESQKMIQEKGLTLLGLVGLKDPCHPGIKKAVQDCQYAGIDVKMITGDNAFTAKAIAAECGILLPDQEANNGSVVEGVDFRNYTEEERMKMVDNIRVMARSSPLDKLLMMQCLRRKGHVVAVTGDGKNDAPALKEADIGLAMGIEGTEVARESSDIVILDDNFATVVTALRWARCVYNNIQKFIQFQLTINVAAVVINFITAVSTGKAALTPAQLLWVILIMDTFGALALATEKPSDELMYRPPTGRSEPLITNLMLRNIISLASYQIAVILALVFKGKSIFDINENVNHTLIFTSFVLLQVFNLFNARKVHEMNVFKGIVKNKLFLGINGITVILQVMMVEFLHKFAHTERLDWMQWGVCVAIAALSWPIGWIFKLVPVQ